jgi:hypothetical protein
MLVVIVPQKLLQLVMERHKLLQLVMERHKLLQLVMERHKLLQPRHLRLLLFHHQLPLLEV